MYITNNPFIRNVSMQINTIKLVDILYFINTIAKLSNF